MEQFFIKQITDYELFNKQPDVSLNGFFDYYDTKETLLNFNYNNNNEENTYEIVENLSEDEIKEKDDFIKTIDDELLRIKKFFEFLIVNLDLNKITIPYYKTYDYSNVPNNLRSKIKTNHQFDIKKFLINNGIKKETLLPKIELITNKKSNELNLNEPKLMLFAILIKIIEIFNCYNKCLLYSKDIVQENPNLIKTKELNLVLINTSLFTMVDNNIEITHFNLIKNAFNKNTINNKKATTVSITSSNKIVIVKNTNKTFEIFFK